MLWRAIITAESLAKSELVCTIYPPFFYCDTSDSWRLGRRARIMISIAGPLSTLVIGSLFVFATYFLLSGFSRNVLQISAFFCFYGTLINFSPFIETDGYYIISDILNIPNLRDESFRYLKTKLLSLLGRPVTQARYSKTKKRIFLIFALIGLGWLLFFGYTTIRLTYLYGQDAYRALLNLLETLLRIRPFSLTAVTVNAAAVTYFALLVSGYFVMGVVGYKKLQMGKVSLETIHDKRVAIFLPLSAFLQRNQLRTFSAALRGYLASSLALFQSYGSRRLAL